MKQSLHKQLAEFGQEHLLTFWDALDAESQRRLAAQIEAVDFASLMQLYEEVNTSNDIASRAEKAMPPSTYRLNDPTNAHSPQEAAEAGAAALQRGEVGALLVAGGEGSRLGFPHPKGMYPLGPISQRSLFEIHFDYLRAQSERAGVAIPLFIMTSPATHAPTVEYLEKHAYFGLEAEAVTIFCQGTMPAVDAKTGKILLAAPDEIALSPDGHGGMLAALSESGGLEACEKRGITTLFYFQVDNPLVRICDPEFLGYHLLSRSELSSQAVQKRSPLERVGTIISVENQTQIIEYSDLPDEVAERRDADGSLLLWAGSVAVHAFDLPFLKRISGDAAALPFHSACKNVPSIDQQGKKIAPDNLNAIKFERFIFDLLPTAKRPIVVEVDAATSFAPVKNGKDASTDTAETSQAALLALHREWAEGAGIVVAKEGAVEISPHFAIDAAALKQCTAIDNPITSPTFLLP